LSEALSHASQSSPNAPALPVEIRERLEDAAESAHYDNIIEIIQEIRDIDVKTADTLKEYVTSFDYGSILKTIRQQNIQ
jgi:hypothetical protein